MILVIIWIYQIKLKTYIDFYVIILKNLIYQYSFKQPLLRNLQLIELEKYYAYF